MPARQFWVPAFPAAASTAAHLRNPMLHIALDPTSVRRLGKKLAADRCPRAMDTAIMSGRARDSDLARSRRGNGDPLPPGEFMAGGG